MISATPGQLEECVERALDKFQFPIGWEWEWHCGKTGDIGITCSFQTYDPIRESTRMVEAHRQLSAYTLRMNANTDEQLVRKVEDLVRKTILEMLSVSGVVQ